MYVTPTIILCLYRVIQDAAPILLDTITLPGKHSIRFIVRNDIHSVILGIENVARSPTDLIIEGIDSLNQHCRLYGHVERYSDTEATRHFKYL